MSDWTERYRQDVLRADAAHSRWLAREFGQFADEAEEWAEASQGIGTITADDVTMLKAAMVPSEPVDYSEFYEEDE